MAFNTNSTAGLDLVSRPPTPDSPDSVSEEMEFNAEFRNHPIPANVHQHSNIFQTSATNIPHVHAGHRRYSHRDLSQDSERLIVRSSMPMPSSRDAPRFTGKNLREFLADYEIGTSGAGWDESQKCKRLPLYCKRPMRDLIGTFDEVVNGKDWASLKRKLSDLYHPDYYRPRYTRKDIEKYVHRKRTITKRMHFAEYYRDFMMRVQYLKPKPLHPEDRNLLFWEGLPRQLQRDIYGDLKAMDPRLDRSVAQDVEVIKKVALAILDKDSVYSRISYSRVSKNESDLDISDSEDDMHKAKDNRRRKKGHKGIYGNLKNDSDNDDSDNDSDLESPESELSESESEYHSDSDRDIKRSRGRASRRIVYAKDPHHHSKRNSSKKPTIDKKSSDPRVDQLTEDIKRLSLQLDVRDKAASARGSPEAHGANSQPREDDRVERLAEELRNLSRRVNQPQEQMNPMPRPSYDNQPRLFNPNAGEGPPRFNRFCWFCGKANSHIIGVRNCPAALQMIKEGLVVDNGFKMTLPDGGQLPSRPIGSTESIEQLIRRLFAPQRDMPPHQGRTSSTALLEPHPAVLAGERYTARTQWSVNDADRTEKRNVRFDPMARTEPRVTRSPSQGRPYVEIPPRPRPGPALRTGPPIRVPAARDKENLPVPVPVPSEQRMPTFPHPPVILKRPTEIKEPLSDKGKLNNIADDDIEMIDGSEKRKGPDKVYTPRVPPKMQFTTNLRNRVDVKKVMESLYEQEVKLPLGVVIGISGEISRNFSEDTRTHKDYITKAPENSRETHTISTSYEAEDSDYFSDDEQEHESHWVDPSYGHLSHVMDVGELKHVLDRSLYAMGTGRLRVKIGDRDDINCMIDTGSELNLISRRLQESLGLPYDPAGSAWGIRGVNGNAEPLFGCCRAVPIEIGGLRFDHIFFVKSGNIGADYDLLMGQPWLKAVAAEIKYRETGKLAAMRLQIYEQGDTSGESLIINLAVDQRREATKLTSQVEQVDSSDTEMEIDSSETRNDNRQSKETASDSPTPHSDNPPGREAISIDSEMESIDSDYEPKRRQPAYQYCNRKASPVPYDQSLGELTSALKKIVVSKSKANKQLKGHLSPWLEDQSIGKENEQEHTKAHQNFINHRKKRQRIQPSRLSWSCPLRVEEVSEWDEDDFSPVDPNEHTDIEFKDDQDNPPSNEEQRIRSEAWRETYQ